MFLKLKRNIILIIALSLGLFLIESLIKYYFILNKVPKQGFYLIPGIFQIKFSANQFIAFGLPVPQVLIIILVLIILSFLWWRSLIILKLGQLLALSLIIIGAVSNLLDRLLYGFVIDYLNIFIWPVFNLADVMVVGGVILYLIYEIWPGNKPQKPKIIKIN